MSETNLKNRRRSQRVLLQVAVLVRAEMPGGKPSQIRALTLVVNAHGGLLESPKKMTADQQITLVNPQTGTEVGCKVVRVEGPDKESFKIAFEFDQRSPRFWPITFPPEDWEVAEEVASDHR